MWPLYFQLRESFKKFVINFFLWKKKKDKTQTSNLNSWCDTVGLEGTQIPKHLIQVAGREMELALNTWAFQGTGLEKKSRQLSEPAPPAAPSVPAGATDWAL